jgi:hypothetical protein
MGIRIAIGLVLALLAGTDVRAQCSVSADCNDNNACTFDICTLGVCLHRPILCDDNNVCTADTCDPVVGCTHTPLFCNDNSACTTDSCDPVSGCVHTPINCNDNNTCTTDTCNPAVGCTHTPINCSDNNACTTDLCDPATGCRHIPNLRCVLVQELTFKLANPVFTVVFKRNGGSKGGVDFVKVSLQDTVLGSTDGKLVRQKVKVSAEITGADAGLGSLLYPVAALGLGNGGLPAVQALGYDVSVVGALAPCQDQLPAFLCTELAQQLSKAIEASLAGDDAAQTQFHDAALALGYPPDACSCTPTTCAAQGANCDSIPDGCGGTLDCGTCTLPETCGGAGIPNRCGVIQ